jgi:hypothetical protein
MPVLNRNRARKFIEPRNQVQGTNSASLCSLAGRYDNPIPPRFLAPMHRLLKFQLRFLFPVWALSTSKYLSLFIFISIKSPRKVLSPNLSGPRWKRHDIVFYLPSGPLSENIFNTYDSPKIGASSTFPSMGFRGSVVIKIRPERIRELLKLIKSLYPTQNAPYPPAYII